MYKLRKQVRGINEVMRILVELLVYLVPLRLVALNQIVVLVRVSLKLASRSDQLIKAKHILINAASPELHRLNHIGVLHHQEANV